jgi:hypothetical protein
MVVLEAPGALTIHAGPPCEAGHRSDVQCGAKLGRVPPADVVRPVDIDSVMKDDLQERVSSELSGEMPYPQWRSGARREAPVGALRS